MDILSDAEDIIRRTIGAEGDFGRIRPEDLGEAYKKTGRTLSSAAIAPAGQLLPDIADRPETTQETTGVILETRKHRDLPFVIRQVAETFGIKIQLFHGPDNVSELSDPYLAGLQEHGRLFATPLTDGRLTGELYNGLFLHRPFWESMIGRGKVLVFQTDAVICPKSPYTLDDFLDFDYIGANWHRERPIGLVIDGGCGGFSLRDWRKSVECLDRFDPLAWTGGEDGYFGFHIPLVGGKVATRRDSSRFCTQTFFEEKSLAVHQPTQLSRIEKLSLLRYCPESWRIISRRIKRTR